MSKDLEIIKQKITENKEYLLKTYGVEEIGVFGSYARGDNDENSDIDIAIEINHDKAIVGFFEFSRMERFLEQLLGRKVDLVVKDAIKPYIKESILAQMIML
jgi:predicted nucleotidyltransferase